MPDACLLVVETVERDERSPAVVWKVVKDDILLLCRELNPFAMRIDASSKLCGFVLTGPAVLFSHVMAKTSWIAQ